MTVCTDGTHLVCTSLPELHAMATYLGLKYEWFQSSHRHMHYDLTTNRIFAKALQSGVVHVSARRCAIISRKENYNERRQ